LFPLDYCVKRPDPSPSHDVPGLDAGWLGASWPRELLRSDRRGLETGGPIIENMSAIRQLDQFAAKGIAETLHRDSRHYVVPIWWGTNPYGASTVLHAASCFFVEIGGTRFGTFHVIAECLADREKHPGGFLMIRNTLIGDWDSRFIDGSSR